MRLNMLGGLQGAARRVVVGSTIGLVAVGATAGALSQGGSEARATAPAAADTVYVNGRVMLFPKGKGDPASLMAPTLDWAQAVAVTNGRISYVGDDDGAKEQIGANTKVVDLKNKLMMPGLGDGHLHGGSTPQCDMNYEGGSIDTVLGKLKACLLRDDEIGRLKSNYVLNASGLMGEGMIPSGTRLDRHVLDRLSRDPSEDPYGTGTTRPIVVRNMDGHKSSTNTKAIQNAGVSASTPDPTDGFIGRDPDGFPNGQFADYQPPAPFGDRVPAAPDAAYLSKVANYEFANSLGITMLLHPGGSASSAALIKRLADDGHLTVRANQALSAAAVRGVSDPATIKGIVDGFDNVKAQYDGYTSPASPGTLSIDTVKIFCDGVPEFPGQTAAMLEPYRRNVGTPENPQWVPGTWRGEEPSCEDATPGFVALDKDHWNIHVHSLGDRSTRVTLDNYEAAAKQNAKWNRRHVITHLEFIDKQDIPRFGKLGVVASMTGQWAQRDGWSVDGIVGYIAPNRMDNMYPSKDLIAGGAVVAQGSDWPVTNLLPWSAIEQFVTREGEVSAARAIYPGRLNDKDGIALAQAYRASTIGVAYQMHQEDRTGSIEVGKYADLIVVDKDPFFIDGVSDKLAEAKAAAATAADALAAAKAARDKASAAYGGALRAKSAAWDRLRRATRRVEDAADDLAAARRAVDRAAGNLRTAQKAYDKSPTRANREALKRAERAYDAARDRRSDAWHDYDRAVDRAAVARRAFREAARAFHRAGHALDAAEGAVRDAKTAVRETAAKVRDLTAAEEQARAAAIKEISDTKVLATMLSGNVVYAAASNPLGISRN